MLNMNGIENEVITKKCKRDTETNKIELLFVAETFESEDSEKEMRKVFEDDDIIYKGRSKKKIKKMPR